MKRGTPYEHREDEFDLGGGCSFTWLTGRGQIIGLIEHHPKPDQDAPGFDPLGFYCGGYIRWDGSEKAKHQLISGAPGDEEHLTIAPSLLCRTCGNHGFIRDGRWVPA
jgi:hypothetical protein